MALVSPLQEAQRHRTARKARSAETAFVQASEVRSRGCVAADCKGEMQVATSRGHRVLVCMECRTSLPVTEDWQLTGEGPPEKVETSLSRAMGPAVDMASAMRSRDVEVSRDTTTVPGGETALDISWLPAAANKYNISPSIRDYAMVPVILFYSEVPNRNGLGFLAKDLVEWSTEYKVPRYKTWRGAPVHYEHDNEDPSKAYGVVLDTYLRKHEASPSPFWKNIAYLAIDRGKHPETARAILKGEISTYSMGAYINGGYVCSVCEKSSCGHIVAPTSNRKYLSLINNGAAIDTGSDTTRTVADRSRGEGNDLLPELPVLAFAVGKKPVGFEVSIVGTPAYPMAQNEKVMCW